MRPPSIRPTIHSATVPEVCRSVASTLTMMASAALPVLPCFAAKIDAAAGCAADDPPLAASAVPAGPPFQATDWWVQVVVPLVCHQ